MELIAINMPEETLTKALMRGGVECSVLRLEQTGNGTFDMVLEPPVAPETNLHPLPPQTQQANRRRSTARGAKNDPRWSRAVYGPKPCTRCGNTIGKNAEMFYVPSGPDKGIYCVWTPDVNDLTKLPCATIKANEYGIARPPSHEQATA